MEGTVLNEDGFPVRLKAGKEKNATAPRVLGVYLTIGEPSMILKEFCCMQPTRLRDKSAAPHNPKQGAGRKSVRTHTAFSSPASEQLAGYCRPGWASQCATSVACTATS